MANRRQQPVPHNQLAFLGIDLAPSKERQHKRKKKGLPQRTESLEQRVTRLEAEVTSVVEQLELEEDE